MTRGEAVLEVSRLAKDHPSLLPALTVLRTEASHCRHERIIAPVSATREAWWCHQCGDGGERDRVPVEIDIMDGVIKAPDGFAIEHCLCGAWFDSVVGRPEVSEDHPIDMPCCARTVRISNGRVLMLESERP